MKGRKKVQFGKKKAKPSTNRSAVMRDEVPKLIPMITDQLSVGMTLRFVTTGNFTGSYTVTYQNLMDAWFLAGTATTTWNLFDFCRIKKVTIRCMAGTYGAASAIMPTAIVGVEFPGLVGGQFGSGKQRMGTGVGMDTPAFVSVKPDSMSQSAQYQPNTANAAFIIRAVDGLRTPVYGAVIDVQVAYKNSGDVAPASTATARAGLTPGEIYFGGLDGLATANTIAKSAFIPIA